LGDITSDGRIVSVVPPIPELEWDRKTLLAAERNELGRFVSDHPLRGSERLLERATHTIGTVLDRDHPMDGQRVCIAGMITSMERKQVKKSGKPWATAVVEDLDHRIEVIFFPQLYPKLAHVLAPDVILLVEGKVKDDATGLVAEQIEILRVGGE
jgi:DNA polymerase-3 subunit alpha